MRTQTNSHTPWNQKLATICSYAIILAGLLALLSLTLLVLFTSPYIEPAVAEQTFWNKSLVLPTLVICVILIALPFCIARILAKRKATIGQHLAKTSNLFLSHKAWILFAILFIYALIWVLLIQDVPSRDQVRIFENAQLFSQGDFSNCRPGNYLDECPYQIGLVWFSVPFGLLLGFQNTIWFGVLNALAFAFIYKTLFWFSQKISQRRWIFYGLLGFGLLFFPLVLFCGFYYGTLLGLAMGLLGAKYVVQCLQDGLSAKVISLACLFCAASVFFKSNYLILIIAIVLISLIFVIKTRAFKLLILPLFIIVAVEAQGTITLSITRAISGYALDQGGSSLTYVLMGIHESDRAPGWFNPDYSVYILGPKNNNITADESKEALGLIKERVAYFAQNPGYTCVFFAKKLSSEWCNPDFQGWWNILFDKITAGSSFEGIDGALKAFFESDLYYCFEKAFLIFVYAYSLIGVFLKRKFLAQNPQHLLLLFAFLGGFLCFMFWEGKSQYVIPFFMCLIPYAFLGVQTCAQAIKASIMQKSSNKNA